MDRLEQLTGELGTLDSTDAAWVDDVSVLLAGSGLQVLDVVGALAALEPGARQTLLDGSHETTTHFKWLVARSTDPRFTLWLHEYKPVAQRRRGYAEVPHDHRYDLASLILWGGYRADELRFVDTSRGLETLARRRYGVGTVMRLRHDQIHQIAALDEGTLTLVVEGSLRKHSSTAYYDEGRDIRTFPDFNARWDDLRARLLAGTETAP